MNARTSRQWIVPHEWMVLPMRQAEWIEKKGLLVWLAEVFSALGMGLYLVGLIALLGGGVTTAGSWWATLIGWLLIVLFKLPLHLVYLGKPLRFWRAIPPFTKAWKTSWLARGMFFSLVFVAAGFVQLLLSYLLLHHVVSGSAYTVVSLLNWIASVVAGVFVLLTGMYAGFAMSYCKSLPFWNTGLLPFVFVFMGLADGLALLMGVSLVTNDVDIKTLESISRVMLVLSALLIAVYLVRAYQRRSTAELAARDLLKGSTAWVFWIGIVALGIVTPLVISFVTMFLESNVAPLLIVAIICHTVGAFALKYSVLKVGIYRSVLPKVAT